MAETATLSFRGTVVVVRVWVEFGSEYLDVDATVFVPTERGMTYEEADAYIGDNGPLWRHLLDLTRATPEFGRLSAHQKGSVEEHWLRGVDPRYSVHGVFFIAHPTRGGVATVAHLYATKGRHEVW